MFSMQSGESSRRSPFVCAISFISAISLAVGAFSATNADESRKRTERMTRFSFFSAQKSNFAVSPEEPKELANYAYSLVWNPELQNKIGITKEQAKQLEEVKRRLLAEAPRFEAPSQDSSPEDKRARAQEYQSNRKTFDKTLKEGVETSLTPDQRLQVSEILFGRSVPGLLSDDALCEKIGVTEEQQKRWNALRLNRMARLQEEYIKRAEAIWDALNKSQQTQLIEIVKRQGPTSAVLSIAWELGFDLEGASIYYPMLSERPVQEKLRLTEERKKKLAEIIVQATESRLATKNKPAGEKKFSAPFDGKQEIEALLSEKQLQELKAIDFRRAAYLALGYDEKKKALGVTAAQDDQFRQINEKANKAMDRIDWNAFEEASKIIIPIPLSNCAFEVRCVADGFH